LRWAAAKEHGTQDFIPRQQIAKATKAESDVIVIALRTA
jgi:hypothetical protein